MHLTMHEDPAHWHIRYGDEGYRPWSPPREIAPGLRKLVVLHFPIQALRHVEHSSRVRWYRVRPDPKKWVSFVVYHVDNLDEVTVHVDFIGDISLADGTSVLVTAELVDAPDGVPFHVPDEHRQAFLEAGTRGASMLLQGDDDGILWFVHLNSRPRDSATDFES